MRSLTAVCAALLLLSESLAQFMNGTALIYRGPAACDGCPETWGEVLANVGYNFSYAGPQESTDVDAEALSKVQVYIQPGGGSLEPDFSDYVANYSTAIQQFVRNGGRYLGACWGMYAAGYNPGFELLPAGTDTDEEITQPGAQVSTGVDTVIQVNWTFQSGSRKGQTVNDRWVYFQDGAVLLLEQQNVTNITIVATYSSNGNVAASISPYGAGWVAVVGPHPEADESWYEGLNFTNPSGYSQDLATDLFLALLEK